MSFSIFRIKTVSGANVAGFILGTALFSMFLMLTLYMQQVLGYSALKTGHRVPRGRRDVDRLGDRRVAARDEDRRQARARDRDEPAHGRAPLLHAGLGRTARTSRDLLPGLPRSIAMGMAFAFVAISIAALAGIEAKDAGLASGLINTSQQIGGALGIAVLSSVAVAHTTAAATGDASGRADDRLPRRLLGRRRDRGRRRASPRSCWCGARSWRKRRTLFRSRPSG